MRPIIAAFATYSRIPMPKISWRDKDYRYAICAFPLVGVVIAAAEFFLLWGARFFDIPVAATVCLCLALPIVITGGIHLDGFIDTSDARSSYGDIEKKLKILKDPHVGAFGIIRLFLYFLLAFAGVMILLSAEAGVPDMGENCGISLSGAVVLPPAKILIALILPVFARALSGLGVEILPKAKKDGMLSGMLQACQEAEKAERKGKAGAVTVILMIWLLVSMGVLLYLELCGGATVIVAELLLFLYYRYMALKEFGGVTGDLAGWYLCMAELIGIWALVLV